MNKYRKLFYSSAVALPLVALAATGVHAAASTSDVTKMAPPAWMDESKLTTEQKAAIEQARALHDQARQILEKAGLPTKHPMKHMMKHIELTTEQRAALEEAKTLREAGKLDEAKAVIEKAGLPVKPLRARR